MRNRSTKPILCSILATLSLLIPSLSGAERGLHRVTEYGAKADGITLNTSAIQSAIDTAATHGGGTVVIPPGRFLSGTLVLKDHVTLRVEAGAVLLGSTDMRDYPEHIGLIDMIPGVKFSAPLIYAENASFVGIEGHGIIDGQGTRLNFPPLPASNLRPGLIRFNKCRFITLQDIHLTRPARWTLHLRDSEDITVRNIRIESRSNRNNDGIDIDGCERVKIIGCTIDAEDDAIVLKSYRPYTVRDIVVADCILTSWCYAFKIGTETLGNVENVTVSNCTMYESHGIALQSVDGANVRNINISNITMNDCLAVLEIRVGNRLRKYATEETGRIPKKPGKIENVTISNILAHNVADSYDYICGIPGYPIEKITLDNIRIHYKGGEKKSSAYRAVPENGKDYPKWTLFGTLPAYGFFIRHAADINLQSVHLSFEEADQRPALHCEKVSGLSIASSTFQSAPNAAPPIRLLETQNTAIRNCGINGTAHTFVSLEGAGASTTYLENNYLHESTQLYRLEGTTDKPIVRK